MKEIFYTVFAVTYISAAVLGLRYFTHMLQLSSYQFQGYFRFLRTHKQYNGLHTGEFVLLGTSGIFGYYLKPSFHWMLTLAVVFQVFLILQYLPKPAKKKFVVTKRVERLFVTYGIVTAILAIISAVLYCSLQTGLMITTLIWASYMLLMPWFTAFVNLINKPIENAINCYYINDAKRILAEHKDLRVIGITGSFGKTSVKYYLTTLLSEGFRVLMTPESFNTPMGVVRTIRNDLKPTHEIFVCEMGARHVGDIREICDIVHPDDGMITSIGHQHLETFHTLDNIINTKYELFDAVEEKKKKKGSQTGKNLKFINGDNEIIASHMKYKDAITYGMGENNMYRAADIKVSKAGTSFTVTSPDADHEEYTTKLVGQHNVENIVGAIACANCMGIPLAKLRPAVRRLESVPHRLELLQHGAVSILDDAYNSNPAGAKVALDTLALFDDVVKILVTPGMVELGDKEAEYNMEFGRQAAAVCDYIILVGKQAQPIADGAREAGFDENKLFIRDTLSEATALMYEVDCGKEKVILLENDLPDNYTK